MAMQSYGWGPPAAAPAKRWERLAPRLILPGGLLLVALWSGVLLKPYGLLAVPVAWLLITQLARASRRDKVRTLSQYALVAVLVVILLAPTAPAEVKPKPRRPPATAAPAAPSIDLDAARAKLSELWSKATTAAGELTPTPPTTTRGGRR